MSIDSPAPPTLISLIGPTASGKSQLALACATHWQTAILSCDARQIYRYMDIGTAKPSVEERAQVPHFFMDICDPDESYNAGQYESEAERLLEQWFAQKPVVILAGGSTLYARALWEGFDEMPEVSPEVRKALNLTLEQEGLPPLLAELQQVDPETYQLIDRNNPARVIRALEVYRSSGTPISVFRKGRTAKNTAYRHLKIGLSGERNWLYRRIDQRVLNMVEAGLWEEVRSLLEKGFDPGLQALQSIGYQEVIAQIQGNISREEAIRLIQRNSRRYAKRQLTYFKRFPDVHWLDASQPENLLDQVIQLYRAPIR